MAWQVVDVPYVEYSRGEIESIFKVIKENLSCDAELVLQFFSLYDDYLYWAENGTLPSSN